MHAHTIHKYIHISKHDGRNTSSMLVKRIHLYHKSDWQQVLTDKLYMHFTLYYNI